MALLATGPVIFHLFASLTPVLADDPAQPRLAPMWPHWQPLLWPARWTPLRDQELEGLVFLDDGQQRKPGQQPTRFRDVE